MTHIDTYLRCHSTVPGWLDDYSATVIVTLSRIQKTHGTTGGIAEIGVHMGRLFILLKLLCADGEKALAIDIFGDQHLNTDQSGGGDRALFMVNVMRHASSDSLAILQKSSLEVRPEEITDEIGSCRLFSIDGGHTAECTVHDLRLADAALGPQGIAILDDYFNPSWPDVSTGAAQFFNDPATRLKPFAVSPNKLYLARPEANGFYRHALLGAQKDFHEKESRMFGSPVSLFGVEPETHGLARRLKRIIRDSPIGAPLVMARRRLRLANTSGLHK
jgi:Methyltransferase domain